MNSLLKDTEQILIGGLFGDAYFIKQKESFNPHLVIGHCATQLDYLKYKYDFFVSEGLVTGRGIYHEYAYLKKTNKYYSKYTFYTKSLPMFNSYYNEFYPQGKKIVPLNMLNKLNPLGLAIWYMDDGSRHISWYKRKTDNLKSVKSRKIRLHTNGFTFTEHKIIQEYFKTKWNIEVRIEKNSKEYVTNFNSLNANKFIEIIKSNILPLLSYKIDLLYNVTNPITEDERINRMSLGQLNSRIVI